MTKVTRVSTPLDGTEYNITTKAKTEYKQFEAPSGTRLRSYRRSQERTRRHRVRSTRLLPGTIRGLQSVELGVVGRTEAHVRTPTVVADQGGIERMRSLGRPLWQHRTRIRVRNDRRQFLVLGGVSL